MSFFDVSAGIIAQPERPNRKPLALGRTGSCDERGKPAVYPARDFVEAGGLVAYGVNYPDLYFRLASFVDKIFKGEKPADLPVEQPTKFEFAINLKTAKILGLKIPPTVLV